MSVLIAVDPDGRPCCRRTTVIPPRCCESATAARRAASSSRTSPIPCSSPGFGHDGQQFYVIARTFPDMQDADGHVDRLKYRARRVLFPALVSVFPAGDATVWAMLGVNLLAIGAAGVAVSRLAQQDRCAVVGRHQRGLEPGLDHQRAGEPGRRARPSPSPCGARCCGANISGGRWRCSRWPPSLARHRWSCPRPACWSAPRARERLAMLVPFGVPTARGRLAVGAWLHPTDAGSASPFGDATRQLALPFDAFRQLGPTPAVYLGLRALPRLVGRGVAPPPRPPRDRDLAGSRRPTARDGRDRRGRGHPEPGPPDPPRHPRNRARSGHGPGPAGRRPLPRGGQRTGSAAADLVG